MRPPNNTTRPTSMTQAPVSRKPAASPSRPTTTTRPNSIALKPKPDNKANGSKPQTPLRPPTSRSANALSQVSTAEKRLQEMGKKLTAVQNCSQHSGQGFSAIAVLFAHVNKAVSFRFKNHFKSYFFQLQQKSYDLNCAFDELLSTGKANDELKAIIDKQIEQSSKSMDESEFFLIPPF